MGGTISPELAGTRIGGRFEILSAIEAGPFGVRFEAVDVDGTGCVLTLFADAPADGFLESARRLAALEHPNLVKVLGSGIDEETGQAFVVEPHVIGRSLADLIGDGDPVEPEGVGRLLLQLCDGLAEAHRQGVVHGSVRSSLVLLNAQPGGGTIARLAGFGASASRVAPDLVTAGRLWTLSYVSPEQARGEPAGQRADVWGLGALAYHALSGKAPTHDAGSSAAWLASVAERDAASLSGPAPWLEPELVRAVHRALVRDPSARCGTADAFGEALRAVIPTEGRLTLDMLAAVPAERRTPSNKRQRIDPEAMTVPAGGTATPGATSERGSMRGAVVEGYEIGRVLGEGGMGKVYEGKAPDGRLVAVKFIQGRSIDDDGVRRLMREAKSAIDLDSLNIVRVHAVGIDPKSGAPFMVMEMLHGADVGQKLDLIGPLEPAVAVRIVADACAGLEVAHEAGLVHRDIKPANLFLHEKGGEIITKICDFGVVKTSVVTEHQASLTRTGALLGSPAYMSPEQARDPRGVDSRSDIWSLAITLYEMLSGELAWGEYKNLGELMAKLYGGEIHLLQQVAPWIEPGLAEVVHKGLERDPDRRFATAQAFREALEPFAARSPLLLEAVRSVSPERKIKIAPRAVSLAETSAAPSGAASTRLGVASPHPAQRWRAVAVALGVGAASIVTWRVWAARQPAAAVETPAASGPSCRIAECIGQNGGKPSRCRTDGRCVALETDRCKVLAEEKALGHPDTVWIGAMFPTADPKSYLGEFGRASVRAMDLARRDFMSVMGGLPSKTSGEGATRPLGIIACDSTDDPRPLAEHLAVEVQVPAVVGFRSSTDVIDLSTTVFIPNDVLTIASLNTSALITSIPHPPGKPRMVWRTAVTTGTKVGVISAFVEEFAEPQVRKTGGVEGPIRVALLRSHDPVGLALSEGLLETLRFNGKSAGENGNHFRVLNYDEAGTQTAVDRSVAAEAARFAPHVVVIASLSDGLVKVLEPFEQALPPTAYRPLYLVSAALEGETFARLFRKRRDLGKRVFGMDTASQTTANSKFTSSYNAAFGEQLSLALSPGAPYDSFYLLAYAAYVAGEGSLGGAGLAGAIARLVPPGKPFDVGPGRILEAFGALQRGESIDLQGAYSRMDFDLASGESGADYVILCPVVVGGGDAGSPSMDNVESGLTFDAPSKHLRGAVACPDRR